MADLSFMLLDPCPLPDKEKKRSLDKREHLIYAPMAGIGGVVYDKVRHTTVTWLVYHVTYIGCSLLISDNKI